MSAETREFFDQPLKFGTPDLAAGPVRVVARSEEDQRDGAVVDEDPLADRFVVDAFGSPVKWLRETLAKMTSKHRFSQDCVLRKLDQVQKELEGPDPTPIEQLLAERAAVCWFLVHWYENSFEMALSGLSIAQANFAQRKIDRAHGRFLGALRTLAQVRKMALPSMQVNIARNQMNVAQLGAAGSVGGSDTERLEGFRTSQTFTE